MHLQTNIQAANPMNVLIFSLHTGAVLQIRLLSPLSHLQQEGLLQYKSIDYKQLSAFYNKDLDPFDLIIFQRVYHPELLKILHWAKQMGKPTIYEIDDQLLDMPPEHPLYNEHSRADYRQCIIEFLQQVDHVTVSTEPLRQDLSQYNSNITLLPNYLDETIFTKPKVAPSREGPVRIGYAAGWTHEDDFRQALPAVRRLQKEYGNKIRLVFFMYMPKELKEDPTVEHVGGAANLPEYARLLAQAQLDIGLAPLSSSRFNECKSDMKFLEYGSQRIAGIYSRQTPYAGSVIDGVTGLFVEKEDPDLWYEKIKYLIEQPEERKRIQQQAHDYVWRERTLDRKAHSWYDLYSRVLAESTATRPQEERPLVSIVMLTFNALEYTRRCVDSLSRHTSYPHEVIFVDNGSTDGTKDYLQDVVAANANYKLIDNETNLGFSAGNNRGVKAAGGRYVLLLNNDVLVADGWLESLVSALERDELIGMVGPVSNYISGRQRLADISYQDDKGYYDFADTVRTGNRGKVTPRRRIAGFAILIPKALYDELGGLDESFGSGNYEDDDLCLRVREKGYAIMVDEGTFIHHFGSRSFKENKIDYDVSLKKNEELFRAKWPEVDPDWLLEKDEPLVQVLERKSQEGAKLIEQGDLENGRRLCEEVLLEDPTKVEAVYGLGLIAHLKGDLLEARNRYQQAVSLNREWFPVQQSLALLDMAEGDLKAAQRWLVQILEKDSHDLNARRLLGQILLEEEQFETGIDVLTGILEDDPNDWQTHFILASLYAEIDRMQDVKRHLEAVLAANPNHAEAREMLDKIS